MRIVVLAFVAFALCGCNDGLPVEACADVQHFAGEQRGQLNLSPGGSPAERTFVVDLAGLPRLWSAEGAVPSSGFGTSFTVAYADPTVGAGNGVEMPRVRLTARLLGDKEETATSDRSPRPVSAGLELFSDCFGGGAAACCPFGSDSCHAVVHVQFERLDAAPFPEVIISWEVGARADVNLCPLGDANPTLNMVERAP